MSAHPCTLRRADAPPPTAAPAQHAAPGRVAQPPRPRLAPPAARAQNAPPVSQRTRRVVSFARTKILPPRPRPGALLPRPALQQRLVDAMLARPLVLVCAPAGFGKTSALTQALDALPAGTAVAWVGSDEGDGPLRLFGCLVAALEPYDPPWRVAPDTLIAAAAAAGTSDAGQRARRALAAELINALDACEVPHGVIVVDDLHRVDDPVVFAFVDVLLERFTPRWSLVLSSRSEPPLALARWRARGEVAEFRAAELRLDAAQSHALAAAAGLDDAAARGVHERTQGWPAGVQLALGVLRSVPGASLEGMAARVDRQVFEFLASEVLDRLPEALRGFLLATSVLPELTAARCAALTGDATAADHLDAVERAGLFVTLLPGPEPTLRLHDLFRDALQQHLWRAQPAQVQALLEQAARTEPDAARRLEYWLRAQSWCEAARELHAQSYSLLTASQTDVVEDWLARFPEEVAPRLPHLHAVRALLGWMHWRWQDMIAAAQAAVEGFERDGLALEAMAARAYLVIALRCGGQGEASEALLAVLSEQVDELLTARAPERQVGQRWPDHEPGATAAMLGREAVVWSAFDDGRLDQLAGPTEASIELLDHTTGLAPLFQMLPLPGYVGLRGMRPVLAEYVRKARARVGADDSHLGTLVQAIDGSLRVWAGEVEAGRALLREAAAEVRWHDFPLRTTLHVHPFLCVADVLLGDAESLRGDAQVLEHVLSLAQAHPDVGERVADECFTLGRLLLAGGLAEEALRVWRLFGTVRPCQSTRPLWRLQRASEPAFVALAEGRRAAAEAGFADVLSAHGCRLDIMGQATELGLRVAALRLELGRRPDAAAAPLAAVFDRHAGDVDIASVWLVGPSLLSALAQAPWGDALADDQRATLQRWAAGAAALRGHAGAASVQAGRLAPGKAGDVAPADAAGTPPMAGAGSALSEREWEVLARIADGDSNKLIARAFDLSPHTVKRHVANILDKLDLRSRGQAAAWYHARKG